MYHLRQAAYSRGEISIEIFIDREIFSAMDKPEHFLFYLMLSIYAIYRNAKK